MATELDKTEAAILVMAAVAVAYFGYKAYKEGAELATSVKENAEAVGKKISDFFTGLWNATGPTVMENPDIRELTPEYGTSVGLRNDPSVDTDHAGQQPDQEPLPEGAESP